MNTLYYGDNLDVMRKFIRDLGGLIFVISIRRSIPNVGYNQIYNNIGTEDRFQAQAFTDTRT